MALGGSFHRAIRFCRTSLKKIFERFQQLEHNQRMASFRGFGLGLGIARSLSYLNLGNLDVTSIEGEGSEFAVTIPAFHPESIVRCYLEQREEDNHSDADITVIQLDLDETYRNDPESIEGVDEFVGTTMRNVDLVMQIDTVTWLCFFCGDTNQLADAMEQFHSRWLEISEDLFDSTLAVPTLTQLGTGQIPWDNQELIKIAVHHTNLTQDKNIFTH